MLVTEHVSNAVMHGEGEVALSVARQEGALRVEVVNEGSALPVVARREPLLEHGAGLVLVAALSSKWGTDPREDGLPGKRVWFALE